MSESAPSRVPFFETLGENQDLQQLQTAQPYFSRQTYLVLALVCDRLDDSQSAVRYLTRCLFKWPDFIPALQLRAELYLALPES